VNFADFGQTILLLPGHYKENLIISAKDLTIRSDNSQDTPDVSPVTISGDGESAVVSLLAGSAVELQGITIRDGGLGVRCSAAQLQMSHCVVTGNEGCGVEVSDESDLVMTNSIIASNAESGINSLPVNKGRQGFVYSDVDITNCTIVRNQRYAVDGNKIAIKNSILYFNGQLVDSAQISGGDINVTFSDVQGVFDGDGNIDVDPLFVDADNGDYRLRTDSPCIDAGDPSDPVGDEPKPNGGRINMGAYGGTAEATRTIVN
jgi:hypothetical protein